MDIGENRITLQKEKKKGGEGAGEKQKVQGSCSLSCSDFLKLLQNTI